MGSGASLASEDEIRSLEESTNFTSKEVHKLLKRYSQYDKAGDKHGLTVSQFLSIPEVSTCSVMPKALRLFVDKETGRLPMKSFFHLLSIMSSKSDIESKKRFAFQVFDLNNDGHLSYDELFGMYRTLTGPVMTDDQILSIVVGVLNRTELEKPCQLSFDEFCQLASEKEVEKLFTVDLQLPP